MTIYTMMSAAKAVKARTGGAIVNYNEEQQGAPPAAAAKPKATPAKAKAAKAPAPVVTGGKARKTGFVLARAKLGAATSELAATRDRQGALLGKGVYRDAERRLAARRRRARCRRRRSRSEGTQSRTRCTRRHSSRGWRGEKCEKGGTNTTRYIPFPPMAIRDTDRNVPQFCRVLSPVKKKI